MLSFNKKTVVGVSVNPEAGLEVALVDFPTRTVLKYGSRQLSYDNIRREIADLDIFKETLQDLLTELQIPKGSEIVLNIPTVVFKVTDYPAALDEDQITSAIEEDLLNIPLFESVEPCISAVRLPNSTIQFNKIAYSVAQKVTLIEIAMQIKELGYTLAGIDTSVNSTLNALIYNERVEVAGDSSWVLLLVENNCCRIIPMQGQNYVDCFEERISIGEVLGDAENYSTVINAVSPILKNIPSQRLYVVSKTDIISAEVLAGKLTYNAQIIHQEANCFNANPFLNFAEEIDENRAKMISLDVIGAAINRDFLPYSTAHLNLFNKSLGDVYILEQPPVINIGGRDVTLSLENMIKAIIVFGGILIGVVVLLLSLLGTQIASKNAIVQDLNRKIADIDRFLAENENISSEMFDEGDEIRMGLAFNKNIYSYYTIVGTEIPQKLWLTYLKLGSNVTIEGQADNIQSIYSFFRNVKDYNPESLIKLQKMGLATKSKVSALAATEDFDTDSLLTSMNADFYQFRISDAPYVEDSNKDKKDKKSKSGLNLEPLE